MLDLDPSSESGHSPQSSSASLLRIIESLRSALLGVAERRIDGDPLPCFCVQHVEASHVHDTWCEDARDALEEAAHVVPVEEGDDADDLDQPEMIGPAGPVNLHSVPSRLDSGGRATSSAMHMHLMPMHSKVSTG